MQGKSKLFQDHTIMTTSTNILRVKRKATEDPVDALLVARPGTDKRLKGVAEAQVFKLVNSVECTATADDLSQVSITAAISEASSRHAQALAKFRPLLLRKDIIASEKLVSVYLR